VEAPSQRKQNYFSALGASSQRENERRKEKTQTLEEMQSPKKPRRVQTTNVHAIATSDNLSQ